MLETVRAENYSQTQQFKPDSTERSILDFELRKPVSGLIHSDLIISYSANSSINKVYVCKYMYQFAYKKDCETETMPSYIISTFG